MKIKNFYDYINEAEKIDAEISKLIDIHTKGNPLDAKPGNDDIGKANEIFSVFLLNNKSWKGIENLKSHLIEKLKKMGQNAAMDSYNAAKYMAMEFLIEARRMGYGGGIKQSIFSAMGVTINGVKVDDRANPSDVICRFGWGPADGWLGMSNKITTNSSGNIGFKNLGMASIAEYFKLPKTDDGALITSKIINDYKAKAIKQFGVTNFKPIRDDKKVQELSLETMEKLQDELFKAMNKVVNTKEFRYIITEKIMNADPKLFPPYLKVTGIIKKDGYEAKVSNPINNSKYLAVLKDKLSVKKAGQTSIELYAGNEYIFRIRFKWMSEPFSSSMKISAE